MSKTDIHVRLEGEKDATAILQKVFEALSEENVATHVLCEFVADQPFGDERTELAAEELAARYVYVD